MPVKDGIMFGQVPRLRAYIWEFPVRFSHWINAFSILFLSVTGYYISNPYMYAISSSEYIMGWMRFVHFTVAYVFLMSMLIRIYWSFMGNKYACWKEFFPYYTPKKRKDFVKAIKFYSLLSKEPPYCAGHAPLASFTYFIIFLFFIFEIVSGFALYSVNHSGAIWTLLGGWLLNIVYLPTIRLCHHLVMYVILIFVPIHIYATWYMDPSEKNGLVSSIFSGYKFVDDEHLKD